MEKGIIVTSFGTTHEDTRKLCIESIENLIKEKFKDYYILRAFTSRVVISRLKENHNYLVENPRQALESMKAKEIKDIYIQPLLIIEGVEYDKIIKDVQEFLEENQEFNIKVGKPLLSSEKDFEDTISALKIADYNNDEGLVLMGHGTYHQADTSYEKMENILRSKGYSNVFLGTVEGEKTIEDIVLLLKSKAINQVDLKPFMLVAGDHAKNDMASDREDSWKSILEKNDIKVNLEIKALGENKEIQNIFLEHLKDILL